MSVFCNAAAIHKCYVHRSNQDRLLAIVAGLQEGIEDLLAGRVFHPKERGDNWFPSCFHMFFHVSRRFFESLNALENPLKQVSAKVRMFKLRLKHLQHCQTVEARYCKQFEAAMKLLRGDARILHVFL